MKNLLAKIGVCRKTGPIGADTSPKRQRGALERRFPRWRFGLACLFPTGPSVAILFFSAWLAASRGEDPPQAGAANPQETVLLFAAASASNALDEIKAKFSEDSGIAVQTSYAASSALAQQIVHGADADLLISADAKWADYLAEKDQVARRQDLLGNRLVIVVPADSKLEVKTPDDLLAAGVEHLALGEPQSVPAGIYAKKALTKLGLWKRLKPKVVSAADVRQALTYVETGAAEAGIVYATDAAISRKVKAVAEIPEKLTGPVRYPLVLLKHGQRSAAAESFYRYLLSPAAAKVFRKHGFIVLSKAKAAAKGTK